VDFENNTFDLYVHHGKVADTSQKPSVTYSTGVVANYNKIGDYGGPFVSAGASGDDYGFDYCRAPDLDPYSCWAASLTYSIFGDAGAYVGYDYYYQVASWGGK